MDCMKDWTFPTTRIADVVKFRPASLELFYGLGCNPWIQGEKSLEWLGVRNGISTERILRQLEEMPVSGADTPWEERPVYFLIDFLTAQHREFIYSDLPAFRTLLEMPAGRISGTHLYRLRWESLHRISTVLSRHIQEEEDGYFPAILKNEYVLHHGGFGRVRPMADELLASDQLIEGEDEMSLALDQWLQSARQGGQHYVDPAHPDMAVDAMRNLSRKILAHEKTEQERLYPMAARIELELGGMAVA